MNEIERDREVDAAWSAASREEPPPALDAAIRAQARRAVGAAPGGARNKHWWYPLAAAATVAALAIGIAQLTPPEQVAPTVVAEQSAAPREAQNEVARQSARADAQLAAPPPAAPAAPMVPATTIQRAPAKATRDAGVAGGAIERERAAAPEAKEEAPARAKLAAPESSKPDATAAATAGGVAAPSPAPPRSEPFPATTPPTDARRDVYAEAPKPAANAPAGAPEAQASRRSIGAAQVESRLAAAKVANVDEAKAKDAGARSVEDWIKRIRELKNEGRLDDAAKELAAFRAAFGERADALLPPDLRAWTPAGATPASK